MEKININKFKSYSEKMMLEVHKNGVACPNPYCKTKTFMYKGKKVTNKHPRLSLRKYRIQDLEIKVCPDCEQELIAKERRIAKQQFSQDKNKFKKEAEDITKNWYNN